MSIKEMNTMSGADMTFDPNSVVTNVVAAGSDIAATIGDFFAHGIIPAADSAINSHLPNLGAGQVLGA